VFCLWQTYGGANGERKILMIRSRVLATTAVLLASIAMATAQTSPQGGAGQSQSPGAPPGAGVSPGGGARGQQEGAGGQDRGAQEGQEKGKARQGAQGKDAAPPTEKGKAQQGTPRQEKGKAREGAQGKDTPAQRGQREQTDQGQRDRQQGERAGDPATMTTQQRTRIRQTVVTKGPRIRNVDFSVSVGTVVPRTVKLVAVPTVLVELYPQYRGRKYFVYNDQIIIVDDDFKIIAIITV
jgi:Protein of unknown function (DUF1236)